MIPSLPTSGSSRSVTCFGVGEGWPSGDRRHASFLYRCGSANVLVDCGARDIGKVLSSVLGTNWVNLPPFDRFAKPQKAQGVEVVDVDGMEVEVAVRHKLPITWIVFNNNGIGGGPATLPEDAPLPPGAFVPNARYDKVIEAFGGKGYHVETPEQFRAALQESFASGATTLINVAINPQSRRRPQQFAWLTRG